jgi:murein DD-endopeptidase MepM/ murein hydrolase activator NlpD
MFRKLATGLLGLLTSATLHAQLQSATVRIADRFDFPVGGAAATGYYKSRGFIPGDHPGEDWNGGPGDDDLGQPVQSIADGVVAMARDVRLGWGNIVIIRHAFYENGRLTCIDSLYGHLNRIQVTEGQSVSRGQQIGTIGNNHGMYDAHLHFEIRKNLAIGMNRSLFAQDLTQYHDPTTFISTHRKLKTGAGRTVVAMNTFAAPAPGVAAGNSTTLRFPPPVASSSDSRIRLIAKRGSFKVNRFNDLEFAAP